MGSKSTPGRLLTRFSVRHGVDDVIHAKFLPNKVILGTRVASTDPISPLLEGRGLIDGKPTVYVCENYACQLLATDSQVLAGQLDR